LETITEVKAIYADLSWADLIAVGLSPLKPELAELAAG
jgi:hypothetical protein